MEGELNKTIRIKATPGSGEKNLSIKIEQSFDFLEVLSLKISQDDVYTTFCANYGVVIGRVISNKAFGIPNAKVSVFIPITEEDENNTLIKDLYPYKTPEKRDGKRYNLLLSKATCKLNKGVGTFPNKETVLNNDIVLEVFEKYYKYTTKTNESGDFMLFGVPVGERIIHMDVDLSDVGLLSVRPYDLISQGAPVGFFDSYSEFKKSTNLDVLPQIKTTNQSVDVIPFWGDPESCEIGITRVDLDTNVDLEPSALFMGSIFSDREKQSINKRCNPKNKMGELDELRTGAGRVNFIRASKINRVEWVQNKNVDPTELEFFDIQGGDIIDEDGTFAITLPMNIGRVITNEFGELVPSSDPEVGLPTKGMYRMRAAFNEPPQNKKRRTANMIYPSLCLEHGGTLGFSSSGFDVNIGGTEDQRFTANVNDYKDIKKDFHLFEWKQLYTIAQYIKKYKKGSSRWSWMGLKNTDKNEAQNNPMPFNTAVKKADFLYGIGSFFLRIGAAFMKFFIILIGLEFGFYFGMDVTIFGICLFKFNNIIRLAPFGWIGDILGKFCNDPDEQFCCTTYGPDARGFVLECDDVVTCIQTNGSNGVCGPSALACCGSINCSSVCCNSVNSSCPTCESNPSFVEIDKACGCPNDINDPNSTCDTPFICLKGYSFVPSESNCEAMQLIQNWLCCRIIQLAEERNVIRRCLFDAWIIGTSYLFQYKYKGKIKSDGSLKEKFCGPGSDTSGGNNYHKNKCCPHDEEDNATGAQPWNGLFDADDNSSSGNCRKCLIRGSEATDKPVSFIAKYHRWWHNATVNGSCGQYSLACGNGATDIGDNIYCNTYSSTKIVSLGRTEMCPDTLNEIQNCILILECIFDLYKQNPEYFIGTFFETGWDVGFWSQSMGITSYDDPIDVLRYLISLENCKVSPLFNSGSGCHENELKDEYYQWVKEISKIYNEIVVVQNSQASEDELFLPGALDVFDNNTISGFIYNNILGQRFSPCGGVGASVSCNQPPSVWSGEDEQELNIGPGSSHNGSKNIPYYYFGLIPGRTAIEKLRNKFFVN